MLQSSMDLDPMKRAQQENPGENLLLRATSEIHLDFQVRKNVGVTKPRKPWIKQHLK
jgi:hypothetical protein